MISNHNHLHLRSNHHPLLRLRGTPARIPPRHPPLRPPPLPPRRIPRPYLRLQETRPLPLLPPHQIPPLLPLHLTLLPHLHPLMTPLPLLLPLLPHPYPLLPQCHQSPHHQQILAPLSPRLRRDFRGRKPERR